MPRGIIHRLFLALRRPSPGADYQWTAVRGLPMHLEDEHWKNLKLFSYRHGGIVHVVEEDTGITVAIAPTVPQARLTARGWLADLTQAELRRQLAEAFEAVNPGPKPKVKLRG